MISGLGKLVRHLPLRHQVKAVLRYEFLDVGGAHPVSHAVHGLADGLLPRIRRHLGQEDVLELVHGPILFRQRRRRRRR